MYSTSSGDWLWVDSGTVGCIRIEDVRDTEKLNVALKNQGYAVDFNEPFATGKERDGIIFFGSEQVSPDGEDLPPYGSD